MVNRRARLPITLAANESAQSVALVALVKRSEAKRLFFTVSDRLNTLIGNSRSGDFGDDGKTTDGQDRLLYPLRMRAG